MQQIVIIINFIRCSSQTKSKILENMRNPCKFHIYLINFVGWDTFRLSKLTHKYTSQFQGIRDLSKVDLPELLESVNVVFSLRGRYQHIHQHKFQSSHL